MKVQDRSEICSKYLSDRKIIRSLRGALKPCELLARNTSRRSLVKVHLHTQNA